MNLKQLKAALDAAAIKLAESPDDAALKAAHEAAKSAYDAALAAEGGDGGDDGKGGKEFDISKLSPEAQKLIGDLRKENGDHRKKNKNLSESQTKLKKALIDSGLIENDEEDPEEKLKSVVAQNGGLALRNAILETAVDHGISKAGLDYFTFLVEKKAGSLEDGEELSDEQVAAIALEVKAVTGQKGSSGTTGAGAGGKGSGSGTPPPGEAGTVTQEQFNKMGMTEKSQLFVKNEALYKQLMAGSNKPKS